MKVACPLPSLGRVTQSQRQAASRAGQPSPKRPAEGRSWDCKLHCQREVQKIHPPPLLFTTFPAHIMATTTVAKTSASSMSVDQRVNPNQSLYLQNLPEKLQKHDLKRSLYMLFSTYGPVLDITAVKTSKMRGQAHVLFRDVNAATQALRALQGFEFYGREMVRRDFRRYSDAMGALY